MKIKKSNFSKKNKKPLKKHRKSTKKGENNENKPEMKCFSQKSKSQLNPFSNVLKTKVYHNNEGSLEGIYDTTLSIAIISTPNWINELNCQEVKRNYRTI